jgi:hypothetical protein
MAASIMSGYPISLKLRWDGNYETNECLVPNKSAYRFRKSVHERKDKQMKPTRPPKEQLPPSSRGFFIFMACCALGAIIMATLLVTGTIQGERVAPDIAHKAKSVD